jgi:hypothetical protein
VRRLIFFVLTILFVAPISTFNIANAATPVVITEPTHRLIDGKFIDDQLAQKLLPAGELGSLVFSRGNFGKSWLVDPATIEEITAMSNGYGVIDGSTPSGQEIAKAWLDQFYLISKSRPIAALIYGNPSKFWIDKLIPAEVEYLQALSKIKLEQYLGTAAIGDVSSSGEQQKLSRPIQNTFVFALKQFDLMSTLVEEKEFDLLKLRITQLLNPNIASGDLIPLYNDFQLAFNETRNKLRVSKGKFTVTSSKQELPITVINDFNSAVKLKLTTRPLTSKVLVRPTEAIEVPANSKIQVLLPIEVIASGETLLLTQLSNLENKPIGFPVNISLKLSVISPAATWITSGAAVILFAAAVIQSLRRFRKGQKVAKVVKGRRGLSNDK